MTYQPAAIKKDTLGINVLDHGVKGDGSTDDTSAMQALIDGQPKGVPLLCPTTLNGYLLNGNTGLKLKRNTHIKGWHNSHWLYDAGFTSRVKLGASFTGVAPFEVLDMELLGTSDETDGIMVEDISLDGNTIGSSVHGIHFKGQVRTCLFRNVGVRDFTGHGIYAEGYTRTADSTYYFAKGHIFENVNVESCDLDGWHIEDMTDSTWNVVHSHRNTGDGYYFTGLGDCHIIGARATWNLSNGYHTAPSAAGRPWSGAVFSACSTDRNNFNGVLVTHTGSGLRPTVFSGCYTRRDGKNGASGGTGTGAGGGAYAGFRIQGTNSSTKTTPVVITGLAQSPGIDDDNTGASSPQYGLSLSNTQSVVVSSSALWGDTDAVFTENTNSYVAIPRDNTMTTGPNTGPTFKTRVKTTTTSYTANVYDTAVLVTTGATTRTVTLPTPVQGLEIAVQKADSGAGAVTVASSSGAVNGTSSLTTQYQSQRYIADGTNWNAI